MHVRVLAEQVDAPGEHDSSRVAASNEEVHDEVAHLIARLLGLWVLNVGKQQNREQVQLAGELLLGLVAPALNDRPAELVHVLEVGLELGGRAEGLLQLPERAVPVPAVGPRLHVVESPGKVVHVLVDRVDPHAEANLGERIKRVAHEHVLHVNRAVILQRVQLVEEAEGILVEDLNVLLHLANVEKVAGSVPLLLPLLAVHREDSLAEQLLAPLGGGEALLEEALLESSGEDELLDLVVHSNNDVAVEDAEAVALAVLLRHLEVGGKLVRAL
mmetsp:Transcript_17715/g.68735  ORF Transcript_17715/g.68735 Transcript_17715/m.68735 type:complete len:273 (-) Transcript_17715:203-1021(-)